MSNSIADIEYVSIKRRGDATILRIRPVEGFDVFLLGCTILLVLGSMSWWLVAGAPPLSAARWIQVVGWCIGGCCFAPILLIFLLALPRAGSGMLWITADQVFAKRWVFDRWRSAPAAEAANITWDFVPTGHGGATLLDLKITRNTGSISFGIARSVKSATIIRDWVWQEVVRLRQKQ